MIDDAFREHLEATGGHKEANPPTGEPPQRLGHPVVKPALVQANLGVSLSIPLYGHLNQRLVVQHRPKDLWDRRGINRARAVGESGRHPN